jgi:hypothetical protein
MVHTYAVNQYSYVPRAAASSKVWEGLHGALVPHGAGTTGHHLEYITELIYVNELAYSVVHARHCA